MLSKASSGIRTHDLPLTERVLYQLSYRGDDMHPSGKGRNV